ncbi:MAG: prephenate dehydrogenase [Dehalococcoidales bacterium]|nr:MAG: prephenate dehydrogenase [Dehalococcoidales bacterium]
MRVAIIGGYGKMGRWITDFLVKDGKNVVLYGRNEEKLLAAGRELGVDIETDLSKAVYDANLIIVSVPIDSFRGVIKQLKPCLASGQVVMDVTSVKVMPVSVMHEYLDDVIVLGTHPVFGPGAKSARNQNFILTPTNDAEQAIADKVRNNLAEKGGLVTMMTPEEHDHLMAVVLGLSHFIAIASADVLLGFEQLQKMKTIGGPTYRVLLTLAESVITEDPELYASIQMNLPGLPEMEELFQKTTETWANMVKSGNRQRFIEKMNLLKEKLPEADPDFGRSYQDMYKILDES